MSAGFEILEHPADLGLRAWAASIPDLFVESASALTDVLFDCATIAPLQDVQVSVAGQDYEYLLYNWLSEVLYLFDGEKLIFSDIKVTNFERRDDGLHLDGRFIGEKYQRDKHLIKTYVKAITFHQLKVETTNDGFTALVYLDI